MPYAATAASTTVGRVRRAPSAIEILARTTDSTRDVASRSGTSTRGRSALLLAIVSGIAQSSLVTTAGGATTTIDRNATSSRDREHARFNAHEATRATTTAAALVVAAGSASASASDETTGDDVQPARHGELNRTTAATTTSTAGIAALAARTTTQSYFERGSS
jgi:hypothetical protein